MTEYEKYQFKELEHRVDGLSFIIFFLVFAFVIHLISWHTAQINSAADWIFRGFK
jgi:hypothetical protein